MKVGLITFHYSHNFGGNLQAYATQKAIEALGHDCEIIDYRIAEGSSNQERTVNAYLKKANYWLFRALYNNQFKNRNRLFETFRSRYMNLGEKTYHYGQELLNDPPVYDVYISGSDQIWNPVFYTQTNAFLLDFAPGRRKKISYAASFGVGDIDEEQKERYRTYLSRYSAISVREEQGKKIVYDLVQKHAFHAADPTLLIQRAQWEKDLPAASPVEKPYICCYSLSGDAGLFDYIDEISKKTGLPVVSVSHTRGQAGRGYIKRYGIGPLEFLDTIRNARFICTDSYHGMLFSIIFEKQFVVQMKKDAGRKNDNARKHSMLRKLALTERIFGPGCEIEDPIDYQSVHRALDDWRAKSLEYLKNALQGGGADETDR